MLYDALIAPFADADGMRRAFAGGLALSFGAPPVGVFLMLRRMRLIGDTMAHALLPGAAIGFLIAGLSVVAMAAGAMMAGLALAIAVPHTWEPPADDGPDPPHRPDDRAPPAGARVL